MPATVDCAFLDNPGARQICTDASPQSDTASLAQIAQLDLDAAA